MMGVHGCVPHINPVREWCTSTIHAVTDHLSTCGTWVVPSSQLGGPGMLFDDGDPTPALVSPRELRLGITLNGFRLAVF